MSSDAIKLPNNQNLNCLFYADDLIILSKTEQGLQDRIDILSNFCKKWKLEVNIKKTKVMTFQKSTRKHFSPKLYLNGNKLDFVKEYTYLGIKFFSSGNFLLAQQSLKDKAMNALYSIKSHCNIFKLSTRLANKIYDSNIMPILTYGSEIWGCYIKDNIDKWDKTPTERAHLHFCKMYLGVNKKTSNAACRSELGRLPINYEIEKRILNYYLHLEHMSDNTISKQLLLLSKQSTDKGQSLFNRVKELASKYNLPEDKSSLLIQIKKSIKSIKLKMTNCHIQNWLNKINSSNKLVFYNSIKHTYLPESYLTNVKNIEHRHILSKFRLSNHDLNIERGRYTKPPTPINQRTCPLCGNSEIESEIHFLFECSFYNRVREEFNCNISNIITDFKIKDNLQKITDLFDNNHKEIQTRLGKYLSVCFQLRSDKISNN